MKNFLFGYWKNILIALVFVSLSGMFNASMDTIDHHYSNSIFTKFGSYFQLDWTRKYEKDPDGNLIYPLQRKTWDLGLFRIKIHPMFFDGWHLFKTLHIFMFILAAASFFYGEERIKFRWKDPGVWYGLIMMIILLGFIWNLSFNLFYDYILILS